MENKIPMWRVNLIFTNRVSIKYYEVSRVNRGTVIWLDQDSGNTNKEYLLSSGHRWFDCRQKAKEFANKELSVLIKKSEAIITQLESCLLKIQDY